MPSSSSSAAVADRDRRGPRRVPSTPLPVSDSNVSDVGRIAARAPRPPATIAAASGCSLARSRLAARRSELGLVLARRRDDRDEPRLAFGERARLVDDERVDLLQDLERLGVLDQHARPCAPRPVPTMIDIGVARPRAHGQAMISTATALTSA